jgi:LPXTG-motif cell wall-anchored protein
VTTTSHGSTTPPSATTAVLTASALPTTGINLVALLAAALAFLGLGGGALAANRRRSPSPEA